MVALQLFEVVTDADPVIADRPVGSILRAQTGPEGLATASYDETLRYRYRLSRVWDGSLPRCAFVMLNPSTATEEVLDPTVRRVHRFCVAWGFGAFEVLNIFALRSTKPKVLYEDADPVGPGNDEAIAAGATAAGLVVCAWGTHGALGGRGEAVRQRLHDLGVAPHHLKLTAGGHPGHPLYLPKKSRPVPWGREALPVPTALGEVVGLPVAVFDDPEPSLPDHLDRAR